MIAVYDFETYPDVCTVVFKEVSKEKRILKFEISSRKNDLPELILYLRQPNLCLVGYNNAYFDYPVTHFVLTETNVTAKTIFDYVQNKIIPSKYSIIPFWKVLIPQIDLLRINHYDNPAKMTSLKWLEFTLRWKKVQDLPFKVGQDVGIENFDKLIEYNVNDVDFTYFFLGKCMDAIIFRQDMSKALGVDVMNYSDVKIGEYLNRVTYEKLSGIEYKNFKDLQTERGIIKIKDLIPDFVKFKTKPFQDFLEDIRTDSIDANLKGDWERHVSIGNMTIKFAKGGLHSEDTPGITFCKEGYFLKEKDVGSMYPKGIIAGNFYPEHLGPAWNQGIQLLYNERNDELKPALKKLVKGSPEYTFIDSKQNAYKLAMNGGGYGKTGSDHGWQKDKLVMFKVTFRGQLSLLMLLEEYYLLGGVDLISANTDGIVIHYPKELDDKVQEIHDKWEIMTDSILEDTFYKQIINRDVNNYIAEIVSKEGDTLYFKYKGCFEFDPEYHKNNSQRIVGIALKEYFINGISPRAVISNLGYHFVNSKGKDEVTTIFDYCEGRKSNDKVDNYSYVSPDNFIEIPDKVVRFYISNSRGRLVKVYKAGKREAITKGFNHTLFMDYYESDDYDINYEYYINECNRTIADIERGTRKKGYVEPEQLKLF